MRLVVTQFWGLLFEVKAYADGAYPQARLKQWLALVAQAFRPRARCWKASGVSQTAIVWPLVWRMTPTGR